MTVGAAQRACVSVTALCCGMAALGTGTVSLPFAIVLIVFSVLRIFSRKSVAAKGMTKMLAFVLVPLAIAVAFGSGTNTLAVFSNLVVILLCAKLMGRSMPRDDEQIMLLSGLLFVAAAALQQDIEFGLWFSLYIMAFVPASMMVTGARFGGQALEAARGGGSIIVRVIPLSLLLLGMCALLFVLIPRVGWGQLAKNKRDGPKLSGFNQRVKLGGHGVIKRDSRVVMRVELGVDRFRGKGGEPLHWRGTALDQYLNGIWQRSASAPKTIATRTITRDNMLRRTLKSLRGDLPKGFKQTIYLEPYGHNVLFGAGSPTHFLLPAKRARPVLEFNDEIRFTGRGPLKYTAYSRLSPPAEELRQAKGLTPERLKNNLQIPVQLKKQLLPLAQKITANAGNRYDQAVSVVNWLASFEYTLEMAYPPGVDPVAHFLFERKKGHCEFFASAMTLLLRSQGTPARIVNGFLGGEWNEYEDFIAVRAGDAHSWVEVYFPGHGWIPFDPTPPGEADVLGRTPSGVASKLRRLIDALRHRWRKWVLEYNLDKQLRVFRAVKNAVLDFGRSVAEQPVKALGFGVLPLVAGWIVIVLFRKRRGPQVQGAIDDPIGRLYWKSRERLDKAYPVTKGETPRQYAGRADMPSSLRSKLRELTELYYRSRFGGSQDCRAQDQARELAASVRELIKHRGS